MRSGTIELREVVKKIGSGSTPKGGRNVYNISGVPFIRSQNVHSGRLDLSDVVYISDEIHNKMKGTHVKPDDVLLNITGASIGRSCVAPETLKTANVNQHVCIIRLSDEYNSEFLSQYINSHFGQYQINAFQAGGNRQGLNFEQIADLQVPDPPLPEQRKIAAILRTWDEAIEKLEKVKQHRKKLFEQRRRSLTNIASGHHVKLMPLSEISEEISRRNDGYDAPVMMISSTQGFIRQDENYDREMAGESLKKYIHLKKGEFAYNKGNSKTYPYGCVFRLNVDEALIPFVYICFSLSPELNASYFSHYFEAGSLDRQLVRLISSSVRGNGLLNIDSEDFFSCLIPVPDRKYQDKSAEYLDAAAKELSVLDSEIAALKNQKRGLMQKLLTGAWRVQVDELPNKKEKQYVG